MNRLIFSRDPDDQVRELLPKKKSFKKHSAIIKGTTKEQKTKKIQEIISIVEWNTRKVITLT